MKIIREIAIYSRKSDTLIRAIPIVITSNDLNLVFKKKDLDHDFLMVYKVGEIEWGKLISFLPELSNYEPDYFDIYMECSADYLNQNDFQPNQ